MFNTNQENKLAVDLTCLLQLHSFQQGSVFYLKLFYHFVD